MNVFENYKEGDTVELSIWCFGKGLAKILDINREKEQFKIQWINLVPCFSQSYGDGIFKKPSVFRRTDLRSISLVK